MFVKEADREDFLTDFLITNETEFRIWVLKHVSFFNSKDIFH